MTAADGVVPRLAARGFDPRYGARPLKRAIQRMVQDPLAMMLLGGKFADGDAVEVDVKGGELVFEKADAQLEQTVPAAGKVKLSR